MPRETLTANRESLTGGMPARDLGPGEVEKMFGPAPTSRQRLEAQGIEFVESEGERGGGGDVDPVEDHFKKVGLDRIQAFIAEQQGKNYPDTSSIKLPDGTSILFGEYKKIAVAIQEAQAKSDRRPAPQPPEPQPAPRLGDWRDSLPSDQRQRLREKEQRWDQLQPAQLTAMQEKIAAALSNWGLGIEWPDELKMANLLADDGGVVLKALAEAVEGRKAIILKRRIEEALVSAPEVFEHVQKLQRESGFSSREAVIASLAADLQAAISIGRNTDVNLFPPKIKHKLIKFIKSGNGKVD